jgi:hypothetical protein
MALFGPYRPFEKIVFVAVLGLAIIAVVFYWPIFYRFRFFPGSIPRSEMTSRYSHNIARTAIFYDVWHQLSPMPDMASFRPLDDSVAVDGSHVWVADRERPEIEAGSLRRLFPSDYYSARSRVYYGGELAPIVAADPATFTGVLFGSGARAFTDTEYALDARTVYRFGVPLSGSDPATFEIIDGMYARDRGSIYFRGHRIPGVNLGSFEIIDGVFSRDARTVFFFGDPITGADPATFEIVAYPYGRDSRSVYYKNSPLP